MRLASLLLLTVFSATAHANDDLWDFLPELPPTSEISIGGGIDSAGGWSRSTAMTIEGPSASLISLSAGDSDTESDRSSLSTQYWSAAFSTDPAEAFSLAIAYDQQDNDDAISSDGVSVTVAFNMENVSLSLTPGQRTISLALNDRFRSKREAPTIKSRDLLISGSWFFTDDWSISASYSSTSYSDDVARLATDPRLQLVLSPETLQLSTSLEKKRYVATVYRYFPELVTGIEWSHSISAIDRSTATSYTLLAQRDLSHAWRLDASAGVSVADYNTDTTLFGNLAVAYRW